MLTYYEKLQGLLLQNRAFVSVTMVKGIGSIPQVPGAKMLVTSEGLYHGTIGGGKLEKRTIEEALQLLAEPDQQPATRLVEWSLGQDIGMTCGGSVSLFFERFNPNHWHIVVFGAGHVAQALIPMLLTLDCRVTCIDPRKEWLAQLPTSPKLNCVLAEHMPAQVPLLPDNAFVVLVTMGHTTDKPILLEILRTRSFPYVGAIGSRAKAIRLRNEITEAGLPESAKQAFFCPIGLDLGSNHPQEIAISIAAQLIQERDRMNQPAKP